MEPVPVSFEVVNRNGSSLPCPSDGDTYRVRGHLIRPATPAHPSTVTLFVHEFSFGEFFWNFRALPGYDIAGELAADGHTSVVIDRLGYDGSDHPSGTDVCLGSQADVTGQIVTQLRSGEYAVDGEATPPFDNVFIAGHSVGAAVAELAAHSFPELDLSGLAVLAWANQGFSQRAIEQSFEQGQVCMTGGEEAEEDGPTGYAYYGQSDEDFQRNVFHSASADVVSAVTSMRNRDPCGDASTLTPATVVNGANQNQIDVPVLLLFGEEDAIFQDGAAESEAQAFSGSDDVTLEQFPDSGHALAFEAAAADVRATLSAWLAERSPAAPEADAPARNDTTSGPPPSGAASSDQRGLPATGSAGLAPLGALALAVAAGTLRRRDN